MNDAVVKSLKLPGYKQMGKLFSLTAVTVLIAGGLAGCGTQQATAPVGKTGNKTTEHSKQPTSQKITIPVAPVPSLAASDPAAYVSEYDQRGVVKMLEEQQADIPGVALTGPNAGTFTLSALNGPLQKKYGGPTVPVSLAAAGVSIPNLPANNSILGVQAFTNAMWPKAVAANSFPGMTEAIFEQGIRTAAEYENDGNSNDPVQQLN